ncbi:alpha/beta fold hydrolase [Hyphomonas sp.]|uniref:alpha/beta fold hydrolase n=1 Tax=Hyphomonas sp. TaxID=87 RepID=UPI0035281453
MGQSTSLPDKRDVFYQSADGLRLYAADYGPVDTPLTVLCMHGLTRNHKDFDPLIGKLNLPCRFISVDVRGRGASERDPNHAYSPDVYVGDMTALLNQLQIDKVTLIGTSMGGLMAMIMSQVLKDRIQGIVLNDVGPAVNPAGLKRIASYTSGVRAFPDWQAAAEAIAGSQHTAFPDFTQSDWLKFARQTCRETDEGQVEFDYDPAITKNMDVSGASWKVNFMMWRVFGRMKKIPLLIIRGEFSDILTPATAQRMCRRHKQCKLVTVPNRGHAPMLSEPEAVSAIADFLAAQMASA